MIVEYVDKLYTKIESSKFKIEDYDIWLNPLTGALGWINSKNDVIYASPLWADRLDGVDHGSRSLTFSLEIEEDDGFVCYEELEVDFRPSFDLEMDTARYFQLCQKYIPILDRLYKEITP